MSRPRYSAKFKLDAVRSVVVDGQRVSVVAKRIGVSEGSLFFWLRRFRGYDQTSRLSLSGVRGQRRELQERAIDSDFEPGTLTAYLRRLRS
jgi:transposase-like protein